MLFRSDLLGPISSKKEGDGTVQGLNGQWATPEEDVTLADALGRVNWAKFGPLFSVLKERMLQEIRGVQVHIVSPEDMFRLNGRDRALGLYEYSADKGENIFIARSNICMFWRVMSWKSLKPSLPPMASANFSRISCWFLEKLSIDISR